MRVVTGIDQLRVHPNLVAGALHAAFHHMRDAELLADLAQIARRAAFVLHDARAADHLQVGDSRKGGQDLVLDAIGEEFVLFFLAQIFEREHRDAFFRN